MVAVMIGINPRFTTGTPRPSHSKAASPRRAALGEVAAPAEVAAAAVVPAAEIAAAVVPAAEVAAAVVPAAEIAAAVVPAAGAVVSVGLIARIAEREGCERLAEQEAGEHAGQESVTAPVRRGESGVHIVDRSPGYLYLAHLGLDPLVDLVRVGGTGRNGPGNPAVGRRPVHIPDRHAMPRVEEA